MSDFNFIIRKKKRFGDYLIKWEGTLPDPSLLVQCIEKNLPQWIAEDSPSIWVRLTGKDLDHINYLLQNGFKMHRIKNESTLVLNRWLRKNSYTLPPAPISYVGVGAMCINDEGLILAIRENFKSGPGPWKLPGGLFERTKDQKLSDVAIRELREETGIQGEFQCVAAQRLTIRAAMFKATDIYTICRLKPLTTEIHFDPIEIADCKWITIEEFLPSCSVIARQMVSSALKSPTGFNEKSGKNYALYSNIIVDE
ncbi:hypothetical protein M9Y10_005872 [Tritrichomonas musculus]|uniref:Nudix hydrolase domain-containing protein n=1 Tax=Tritrichomonas musculus TaxID=1915356 RepID=A0ABR2JCR3_9EUKA